MTNFKRPEDPVQNYPLTLTTLTPVCVKSHEEPLSPLADYSCKNQRIYFINPSKFLKRLENKVVSNDYIKMITETNPQGEKKNERFNQFLENNNINIEEIADENYELNTQSNLIQIARHIRSAGKPYIPGSSLKGAVTTVLFYNWMKTNKSKWENQIIEILDKYYQDRNNLDNGGINDKGKDNKSLINIKKNAKKELKVLYNKYFKKYLDSKSTKNTFNYATLFGFEDSNGVDKNAIQITDFFRYNINSDKSLNPNLFEVIKNQIELKTSLSIQKSALFKLQNGIGEDYKLFEKTFLSGMRLEAFFNLINEFSLKYITTQLEFLSNVYRTDNLDNYLLQLQELNGGIKNLSKNSAVLALGFGKSFLQTTIIMLLDDERKKILLSLNKNASDKKTAPKTFYMNDQGYPLGWIKITDPNTEAYKEEIQIPDYDINKLQEGGHIQGLLIKKGGISKVKLSINKEIKIVNASGISKFERFHQKKLEIGQLYDFEINVIKDAVIKEIKK